MDQAAQPEAGRRRARDLGADRIASEALALIDAEGLEGFSFRVLARRLGCQAMSIYHYFPSKAHLYEALIDRCIAECPLPDRGTWRDKLEAVARAYRRLALRHPGFFLYFSIFRMNNRSGLAFLDGILGIFGETGLPPERRAVHFRAVGYFLTGAGLDEAMGYAHGPSATDPVPKDEARRDFPAIMAVGPFFGPAHHQAIFEAGLKTLLDAIEGEVGRGGRG